GMAAPGDGEATQARCEAGERRAGLVIRADLQRPDGRRGGPGTHQFVLAGDDPLTLEAADAHVGIGPGARRHKSCAGPDQDRRTTSTSRCHARFAAPRGPEARCDAIMHTLPGTFKCNRPGAICQPDRPVGEMSHFERKRAAGEPAALHPTHHLERASLYLSSSAGWSTP